MIQLSIEFQGEDFIYAVTITDPTSGGVLSRPFNQTDGSSTLEFDEVELDTKDKTGSGYGKKTETVSLEGVLTEGDPFPKWLKKEIKKRKLIEITEINTRTLETEKGMYMITSFERTYSNGENAQYSLEGKLNGETTEGTVTEVPEGAPDAKEETPVV